MKHTLQSKKNLFAITAVKVFAGFVLISLPAQAWFTSTTNYKIATLKSVDSDGMNVKHSSFETKAGISVLNGNRTILPNLLEATFHPLLVPVNKLGRELRAEDANAASCATFKILFPQMQNQLNPLESGWQKVQSNESKLVLAINLSGCKNITQNFDESSVTNLKAAIQEALFANLGDHLESVRFN